MIAIEMLREMEKNKGARGNPGGRGAKIVRSRDATTQPKFSDIGVTKTQSSRWQKLAVDLDSMSLRQFSRYWWSAGRPLLVPQNASHRCAGSFEFILFRSGRFQVEQVVLFPGVPVPEHRHPDVDSFEFILSGAGEAYVNGVPIPALPPAYRRRAGIGRVEIRAGVPHWGVATEIVVALSVQLWLHGVTPTFITENWEGEKWR